MACYSCLCAPAALNRSGAGIAGPHSPNLTEEECASLQVPALAMLLFVMILPQLAQVFVMLALQEEDDEDNDGGDHPLHGASADAANIDVCICE